MENRKGLIVDVVVTKAKSKAERKAALGMLDTSLRGDWPTTLAVDRGYHTQDFVEECRIRNVRPRSSSATHPGAIHWSG
jgi:Transposase DDE domain